MDPVTTPSETPAPTETPTATEASTSPTTNSPTGMQVSVLALITTAVLLAIMLFFAVPPLIDYSRYIIPEEVAELVGRPGLKPDQAAQVSEQVRNYYKLPTRTFFPISAAIIASLFAFAEGICWRRGGIILLALIAGPAIGCGMGYAVAEISMMYYYSSGKAINPAITDGLAMQTIAMGLIGSGAGLAIGVTARSIVATIAASIAGILSGFVASCVFVIGTAVIFPLQDVFYPIPGMKLEGTSDYGAIAIWSVALPICLGVALSTARKKTTKPAPTSVSSEKSAT